jgi:hypothetical protein
MMMSLSLLPVRDSIPHRLVGMQKRMAVGLDSASAVFVDGTTQNRMSIRHLIREKNLILNQASDVNQAP